MSFVGKHRAALADFTNEHDAESLSSRSGGFALGGGFELALSRDLIIAASHASFGLPEPRVGLLAGAGGVHRLPRQVPYHIAMGVILAGNVWVPRKPIATVG